MENVLEVKGLSVAYKGRFPWQKPKLVLQDISLTVPKGKILVILGGNGSGKSTLLKALANSTENDFDRRTRRTGEILFEGENILSSHKHLLAYQKRISFSMQGDSAEYYEERDTVRTVLLRRAIAGMEAGEAEVAVNDMLAYFAAEAIAPLNVRALSGGQLRLLSIMECLIKDNAEAYFIDEPYNDLDDDRARRVSNYLIDLHERRPDAAIVVITHCKKIPDERGEVIAHRIADKHVSPCGYECVPCLGYTKDNRYVLS